MKTSQNDREFARANGQVKGQLLLALLDDLAAVEEERDLQAGIIQADEAHVQSLEQQIASLEQRLEHIADWCKAYPREVFIEPDWAEVKRLLGATLLTQVSAANMRHVVEGIAHLAALSPNTTPEGSTHGAQEK